MLVPETNSEFSEFFCESAYSSLEELFKKVILFLILDNLHDSSLGRRVNKASHNSLEIQTHSITQTIAKRRKLLK